MSDAVRRRNVRDAEAFAVALSDLRARRCEVGRRQREFGTAGVYEIFFITPDRFRSQTKRRKRIQLFRTRGAKAKHSNCLTGHGDKANHEKRRAATSASLSPRAARETQDIACNMLCGNTMQGVLKIRAPRHVRRARESKEILLDAKIRTERH
jgi:hypothetical protein